MRSAPSGSPSRPDDPRRRIRPSFDGLWRKAAAPFAVLLASIPLAGCNPSVLNPKGPVGVGDGAILVGSVIIMLAIVVPTIARDPCLRLVVPRRPTPGRATCPTGSIPAGSS